MTRRTPRRPSMGRALALVLATCGGVASAQDTFSGGIGVAYLPQEFVLGGANVLAANYDFPGNPAVPVINGGQAPLFDPVDFSVRSVMTADAVDNGDGTFTVSVLAATADGQPFVTKSTNTLVQTADGLLEATDLVVDFGNGYSVPGFPVDGFEICGEAVSLVEVRYYFVRTDGSVNEEFGSTSGPYIGDTGFTFAWGYAIADARTFNVAGFDATFAAWPCTSPCPSDLNGDGSVDAADLSLVLGAWGSSGPAGDINGDGSVDAADLSEVLGAWGPCL